MIFQITSRSNEKIKHVVSLRNNKKLRQKEGLFVLEGKNALKMALAANLVTEVYTLKKISLPKEVSQYVINESVLEKISSTTSPEGIVFVSKIPNLEIKKKDKILYLDNIQDPGNFGTLIRSALALNFDCVMYSKNSVDPYNDKTIASTKGALFNIPVVMEELSLLKEDHLIIVSTLSNDSQAVETIDVNHPFVLVLGNEAHGVTPETLELADKKVKIPMHDMESLNVAVAGGILMYELNKNSKF